MHFPVKIVPWGMPSENSDSNSAFTAETVVPGIQTANASLVEKERGSLPGIPMQLAAPRNCPPRRQVALRVARVPSQESLLNRLPRDDLDLLLRAVDAEIAVRSR